MTIEERLKETISNHLGVDFSEIVPDAKFTDDLGADSLDLVELVMAIEDEFNIVIPDEDAEKLPIVGDVIKYLKGKVRGE